jgi:LysR family transcriptional regulator, hydrogen peroxide-inducible genes activator
MEMSHIRYFLAVCSERNFTRAARRCGVAQPSLTRGIHTLEQELGGRLFHRRFDGAALTSLGLEMEPHFAAIARNLAAIERARRPPQQAMQSLLELHGRPAFPRP